MSGWLWVGVNENQPVFLGPARHWVGSVGAEVARVVSWVTGVLSVMGVAPLILSFAGGPRRLNTKDEALR